MSPTGCDFWLVFNDGVCAECAELSRSVRLSSPSRSTVYADAGRTQWGKGGSLPLDFRGEPAWRGRWKLRMEGNNEGHH